MKSTEFWMQRLVYRRGLSCVPTYLQEQKVPYAQIQSQVAPNRYVQVSIKS